MANYLLALLGGGPFGVRENPLYGFPTGNPFGLHDGRMGDYVFSQEGDPLHWCLNYFIYMLSSR